MLILSRYPGETIVLGDEGHIKMTVLSVVGKQVRLGIDAPKTLAVHRLEIYNRIREEKGLAPIISPFKYRENHVP